MSTIARSVAGVGASIPAIDAQTFGAVPGTTADMTTPLQNWLNAVTAAGARGVARAGTYKITAPLLVGAASSDGWSIEARGVTLQQATSNTPILKFTKELTRRFLVDGLTFTWTTAQPATNTGAVGILFDSDTDSNFGWFNFRMANLRFVNGFRGVQVNEASANRNPVWGAEFDHLTQDSTMTGALLRLKQVTSGQPNLRLTNTYVRGDNNTDQAVVDLQGYHGVTISGLEFNDVAGRELLLTTCEAVEIDNLRSERGTMTNNLTGLWTFSDVRARISSIEVQSKTFDVANWAYIIRAISTNTQLIIGNATVLTLSIPSGQVALVNADTAASVEFDGGFRNGSSITKFYQFDNTPSRVVRDGNDFGGQGALLKELTGAGKVTVADGDFLVTPANRTAVLVRNTTDGSARLAVRVNGAWCYAPLDATDLIPGPAAGLYFYPAGENASSTSATLGTGTLRLVPWLLNTSSTVDRIAAEVTTAGDVGSKVRLGIYGDTGACYPGALLLDAGQIAGDATGAQALTVSLALPPGLYWVGGVVQTVTTTQPTLRTVGSGWTPPVPLGVSSTLSTLANNIGIGFQQASVTGALPGTFTTTVLSSGSALRPILRFA